MNKTPENQSDKNPKSPVAVKEEEILKFWEENKIFEKSLKKNEGKDEFVFYDGPPFATGLPHYGHILGSTVKDAIPRYKTMRGFYVRRQWGWDCHGLPIENIVEKDLGVSGKNEIENLGINRFNTYARSKVLHYVSEWKKTVERIGRWVDFEGSYKTMDNSYMESVFWALKNIHGQGLIYESTKVLPYCPRCETPIAQSEIAMDNSYKDITDISVYVKFELKEEGDKEDFSGKTYLLVWTTTPWTLPGNFAAAVNSDLTYLKIKFRSEEHQGEYYILAKDRIADLEMEYDVIQEFKGKDLLGKKYIPPFNYFQNSNILNIDRAWKIYAGDFVTSEDGTGIVHIAPGYGEDDMVLAKKENIPFEHHVGRNGKFLDVVSDFKGLPVKPKTPESQGHQVTDILIIKYLAHNGILFQKKKLIHSYPHCFRCETPLYYYALPAWFIKISNIKENLLKTNERINWIPGHLKEGRYKNNLLGAPDWNISRNRFWATPLPFWKCEKCKKMEVLGSLDEIKEKNKSANQYYVMRHGEAESNVLGIVSSDPNLYGLTEKGKAQVKDNAQKIKHLGVDLIIASPYKRTRTTAMIVKEELCLSDDSLIFDSHLHEIETGVLNGKTIQEYRSYAFHHDRFKQAPSKGESQQDVKRRMGDFVYRLEKKYFGKKILIITHDTPAWLLFAAVEGMTPEETFKLHDNKKFFLGNAEIRELPFNPIPHNGNHELDFHRPYIDSVVWKCDCGGQMKRIEEVIDCWFESGSMPFASRHYPFSHHTDFEPNGGLFKKTKGFPADFISEYVPQTRTWFYYLHSVSMMLFKREPFKNVVTTGNILAEDGQKMSKSKGNFPDPWMTFGRYGVDALRLYLLSSPVMKSEDLKFSEKGVDEIYKRNILRLQNVVSFYEMYGGSLGLENKELGMNSKNVLDIWIITRLNEVILSVTEALEKYEIDRAIEPIEKFVDDLSTWYLRRSRDRFKSEDEEDKSQALKTTSFVLVEFSKVLAPLAPFISEDIYQRVRNYSGNKKESVHMEDWPKGESRIKNGDLKILEEMKKVRKIVSLGLEARAKLNIKVRQPLKTLKFRLESSEMLNQEMLDLIKDEVNVKEAVLDNSIGGEVELDSVITEDLKEEGYVREFIRAVQELRKKEKLTVKDVKTLKVDTDDYLIRLIEEKKEEIMRSTNLENIEFIKFNGEVLKIDGHHFKIDIN